MVGLSNYAASLANDYIFGKQTFTIPATLYCAISKGAVTESDTGATFDECDYTSYARVALTNNNTNFPNSTAGSKNIGVDVTFPTATGGSNTITEFIILDSATIGAGNIIGGGSLLVPQAVSTGIQPVFVAGDVEIAVN